MAPGSPTPPQYRALEGPHEAVRCLVDAIRREPGISLPELAEATGLAESWIKRLLLTAEAFGAITRQKQRDRHTGRWVICVRMRRDG